MSKVSKFAKTNEFDKHVRQSALYAHRGGEHFFRKNLDCYQFKNLEIADDDSFTLPTRVDIDWVAWGWITASFYEDTGGTYSIEAWANFLIDGDGDVTLINNSSNVVANADTDGKLCLGTSSSQEPLVIKNRLGALGGGEERKFTIMIFYN